MGEIDVLKPGTRVMMTKGYMGVKGVIVDKLSSLFDFYVIELENGINMIAGPSAFTTEEELKRGST